MTWDHAGAKQRKSENEYNEREERAFYPVVEKGSQRDASLSKFPNLLFHFRMNIFLNTKGLCCLFLAEIEIHISSIVAKWEIGE